MAQHSRTRNQNDRRHRCILQNHTRTKHTNATPQTIHQHSNTKGQPQHTNTTRIFLIIQRTIKFSIKADVHAHYRNTLSKPLQKCPNPCQQKERKTPRRTEEIRQKQKRKTRQGRLSNDAQQTQRQKKEREEEIKKVF